MLKKLPPTNTQGEDGDGDAGCMCRQTAGRQISREVYRRKRAPRCSIEVHDDLESPATNTPQAVAAAVEPSMTDTPEAGCSFRCRCGDYRDRYSGQM
jgi:hypothetical protein